MANDQRPDAAFTTDRAVRAGKANASSGRIMVTIPADHFGPIPAANDPINGTGVRARVRCPPSARRAPAALANAPLSNLVGPCRALCPAAHRKP